MKSSSFVVSANGPDLSAARALPPSSALANTLSSVTPYARQGLDPDVQERLVGLSRRMPLEDLSEVLSCSRREENMMFSAAVESIPMGGPVPAYGASPALSPEAGVRRGVSPRTPRPTGFQ